MEVLHICLCFMVIREVDPHMLGLTDKLIEVVIEEAKACGTRQPVVIAGDLNARNLCCDHGNLKWTVCGLGESLCFGEG